MNRIFSRKYRLAWGAAALVLVLGISLAFPPVQAIANSFLGLFRVQQVEVVQVNPGNLPNQLGSSTQLQNLFSQDVQMKQDGQPQTVSTAAEASTLAGIPVRLPQDMSETPKLTVQPGGTATFTVDLPQIRAILQEIGRSDIQLPDNLNGAKIELNVSKSVTAEYGDCTFDLEKARQQGYDPDNQSLPKNANCTTFVQMPSPTISAPAGIDINQIGQAYLQILGMSKEQAQAFSQSVDWTSTLVIPIPRYGTSYQTVSVEGVNGTLIQQTSGNAPQYMLIWVKNGIVNVLTGPGNGDTAVSTANSLQ